MSLQILSTRAKEAEGTTALEVKTSGRIVRSFQESWLRNLAE